MKLLTKEIKEKLLKNHKLQQKDDENYNPKPVVKFFNPTGLGTWLIADMDEDGICFGLCDLGEPELGYVALKELEEIRLPFGLGIERDIHWEADKTLQEYAIDANEDGYINA